MKTGDAFRPWDIPLLSVRIRDPIHGTIAVCDEEKMVIDNRFYQRLRHVRQLGFGDLAFPGATHTRHAHSLGAMHVAGRLFDSVAARSTLSEAAKTRFRMAVRLAVLCHDIGHMPLSHASESIAPKLSALKLPAWLVDDPEQQATHEDYSAKIVVDSSLTKVIDAQFSKHGITPADVAFLITGHTPPEASHFVDGGVDWAPLLRAIVSGELDADRMDYLLRDSFFTGVQYGRYDLDWIISNLNPAEKDGRAYLALSRAAAFAFEDFLLSRYHMFVSVYLHHTSVNFDHMLQRYYEEARGEFEIPADPEAFLTCDDVALQSALRKSKNAWAQRIVARQGFKLVLSFTERDRDYDLEKLKAKLAAAGIEHFSVTSKNTLSRYSEKGGPSLFIIDVSSGRLTEVAKYTPLYQRYAGAVELSRLYVRPDQADAAREMVHHG